MLDNILSLLVINDLPSTINSLKFVADDLVVYHEIKGQSEMESLQEDMDKVAELEKDSALLEVIHQESTRTSMRNHIQNNGAIWDPYTAELTCKVEMVQY